MKRISLFLIVFLASVAGFAQDKWAEVSIKTVAQCEMCKTTIDKQLAYEPGVKSGALDLETSTIHVKYNPKKTDIDKLRASIASVGYDADEVKADPEAYQKLPGCCKKP